MDYLSVIRSAYARGAYAPVGKVEPGLEFTVGRTGRMNTRNPAPTARHLAALHLGHHRRPARPSLQTRDP